MVAIFGGNPPRIFQTRVYFRLKQFILDIYNGRGERASLQCRSVVDNNSNNRKKNNKNVRNVTFRRIYCFNNGK